MVKRRRKDEEEASHQDSQLQDTDFIHVISVPDFPVSTLFQDDTHYKLAFSELTGIEESTFLNLYFEKHPCHFKRNGFNKSMFLKLASKEMFLSDFSENVMLLRDNMKVVKYQGEDRKTKCFDSRSEINSSLISKCFEDGYTLQFFQPQRFSDGLYFVNAGFEHVFGTLAGSSVYMTPPNTQGLAPHHDDVEVFILQTEGQKLWKLWPGKVPLPETYSSDIPRNDLPDESYEVLLSPGDVLYLPRGTIHEAKALDSFSTHVTISVYQYYNVKSLLLHIFPQLLQAAFDKDIELRRGLPVRMSKKLGTFVGKVTVPVREADQLTPTTATNSSTTPSSNVISWRESYLSHINGLINSLSGYITNDMIDIAADEMQEDFMLHRLPPPDIAVNEEDLHDDNEDIEPITAQSYVRIIDPSSFHMAVINSNKKEGDGDEGVGVEEIAFGHSRCNSRLAHMGHPTTTLPSDDLLHEEEEEEHEEEENDDNDDNESTGGIVPDNINNRSDGNSEQEQNESVDSDEEENSGSFQINDDDNNSITSTDNIWQLVLPLATGPLIQKLIDDYMIKNKHEKDEDGVQVEGKDEGILVSKLSDALKSDELPLSEILITLSSLQENGFLEVVKQQKKKKEKKKFPVYVEDLSPNTTKIMNQNENKSSSNSKKKKGV